MTPLAWAAAVGYVVFCVALFVYELRRAPDDERD